MSWGIPPPPHGPPPGPKVQLHISILVQSMQHTVRKKSADIPLKVKRLCASALCLGNASNLNWRIFSQFPAISSILLSNAERGAETCERIMIIRKYNFFLGGIFIYFSYKSIISLQLKLVYFAYTFLYK